MSKIEVYQKLKKSLVLTGLGIGTALVVTGCSSKPETTKTYKVRIERTVFAGDSVSGYYEELDTGYENLRSFIKDFKKANGTTVLTYGDQVDVPYKMDEEEYNQYLEEITVHPTTINYTLPAGETLSDVCDKYQVTLSQLLKDNPEIDNPNLVPYGITLKVSTTEEAIEELENKRLQGNGKSM